MAMDFKQIPEGFLLPVFENFYKVFPITIVACFLKKSGDRKHGF